MASKGRSKLVNNRRAIATTKAAAVAGRLPLQLLLLRQ